MHFNEGSYIDISWLEMAEMHVFAPKNLSAEP